MIGTVRSLRDWLADQIAEVRHLTPIAVLALSPSNHTRRSEMSPSKSARSPYWNRMLSRESAEEIADRMRDVLDKQYFTLVTCNSFDENNHRFSSVDVMPSQWLCGPVALDRAYCAAHIGWVTPRLSMGVSTHCETVSEARKSGPHDYVHFTFEPGRVVIDHYAPARYRLQWIFAVERHDRDGSEVRS